VNQWRDACVRCLPEPLANLWVRNNANLLFRIGDTSAELLLNAPGHPQTLETVELSRLSSIQSTRLKTNRRNVHVLLPSGSYLRKQLTLPLSAQEDLRGVLALEMNRLTPFSTEQVYFDFRILSSEPQNQSLSLELAVVQRERVDGWLTLLKRSGFVPRSIGIDNGWHGLNLLLPQLQQALSLKSIWPTFLLATLVLVLGTTAWYLPLLKQQQRLQTFRSQVANLAPQVEEMKKLHWEIEELRTSSQQLIDIRRTTRPIVDIVLELTNLLPNDSWLRHLQVKTGEIVMTGETKREADLLVHLERSPMFKQVRFVSPLTRIPGSPYTRFHLSAALQGDQL